MIQTHPCKFCKKPVTLSIDDDHAVLADPFGLLRLAACDRCSDYESARRQVVRNVKRICELLIQRAVAKDDIEKARESLETLVKKYMRLYAEYNNLALADYEPQLVDALMGKPTHFGQVLCRIPSLFAQRALI